MKTLTKNISIGLVLVGGLLIRAAVGLAQTTGSAASQAQAKLGRYSGMFNNITDLSGTIGLLIGPVAGLTGSLFLVLIITGGVMWMTAGGSEEQVGRAKKMIIAATTGLLLVLFAYSIASFVVSTVESRRNGSTGGSTTSQIYSCVYTGPSDGQYCKEVYGPTNCPVPQAQYTFNGRSYGSCSSNCPGCPNVPF